MLLYIIALLVLALQVVTSHTVFTTLFINDTNQGDATCVRMPKEPDTCTRPVNDLNSNDMACGADGAVGVARVCPVMQGSKLTFLFRETADGSVPGTIDGSHKGPCAIYMKSVTSAITDPGHGNGWFKIWESGYDSMTYQWCTEKLIQNNGLLSVDIPNDIAGGYYLIRPEILALHEADKSPPNPQFYTGCAQIFLQSSGTRIPLNTVSIPGYVQPGDSSVTFNIYTPKWPYPMPGPALYKSELSSLNEKMSMKTNSPSITQIQKEGLLPDDCILSNGNWCGIELDSYNTETGCWNASAACREQEKQCYDTAPPTGSKNCPIWDSKCQGIHDSCNSGNFNGPPNKGKDLSPAPFYSFHIPSAYTGTSMASPSTASIIMPAFSFKPETIESDSLLTDSFVLPATSTSSLVTITTVLAKETMLVLSTDATCGSTTNFTCLGSIFGSCCSPYGWCGTTDAYCGQGCQEVYGTCSMR